MTHMNDEDFAQHVTSIISNPRHVSWTLACCMVTEARRAREREAELEKALNARVAKLGPLATFGAAVIENYFNDGDFGDLDGGWVQDKAVDIGLLVHPETAHDPNECEGCADEPRSCYVLSAAAALAHDASVGGGDE